MIISVLNLKGGAGKTTLATNIAARVASNGLRTLLLDTDRQRSAVQWYEVRHKTDENLFCNSITEPLTLTRDLMRIEELYDCMVVDGAPNMEATTAIIATLSDQVLVPIQPSGFDLGATRQFLLNLQNVQYQMTNLKVMIVFNRINPRTSLAQDMIESVEGFKNLPEFKDFRFRIAKTHIQNRVVYADAASTGEIVFERKDEKAKQEIQSLLEEIRDLVDEPTPKTEEL